MSKEKFGRVWAVQLTGEGNLHALYKFGKNLTNRLSVFIIASEVIGTHIQWGQVGSTKVLDSQLCIHTDHVP